MLKVYKSDTTCASMDELRYHLYHHSKKTIINLPPTSRVLQGHIMRALFGSYLQMHCLDSSQLDPTKFGYHKEGKMLAPDKNQSLLPDDFPNPCKCTSCATKRCSCRKLFLKCCEYFKCKVNKGCKNPLK
jgi:hypothetical protein